MAIREIGVQMCAERLVLLPMSLAGHWTLLAIDVELHEVRFTDTLPVIKMEILEKVKVLLQILREEIPGPEWLPAGVEGCRIHHSRQRGDLSCGYYVAWFCEEELRQKYGESPFHLRMPEAS